MSLRRGMYARLGAAGWTVTVHQPMAAAADRAGAPGIAVVSRKYRALGSELRRFGAPDHGVSVYLDQCRCCAVPLLALVPLSEGFRSTGPFLEVSGARL